METNTKQAENNKLVVIAVTCKATKRRRRWGATQKDVANYMGKPLDYVCKGLGGVAFKHVKGERHLLSEAEMLDVIKAVAITGNRPSLMVHKRQQEVYGWDLEDLIYEFRREFKDEVEKWKTDVDPFDVGNRRRNPSYKLKRVTIDDVMEHYQSTHGGKGSKTFISSGLACCKWGTHSGSTVMPLEEYIEIIRSVAATGYELLENHTWGNGGRA